MFKGEQCEKMIIALLVMGSFNAFAEGEGSGDTSFMDQYNAQYGDQRQPVCTGVKIVAVNNTGGGDEGGRPEIVYDLSEAVCQPARIWTLEELNSNNSNGGN